MEENNKYEIGFIGAGKAGVTLGSYFVNRGLSVKGYVSRTKLSALHASALTQSHAYDTMQELLEACNVVFITTPDSDIASVYEEMLPFGIRDKLIIHTSGSLSSDIFRDSKQYHAFGYSLHPMYAFSKKDGSFEQLEQAYFTLEGAEEKRFEVKNMLSRLGNPVLFIDTKHKPLYHLANVLASNFVLALISQSLGCLEHCQISGDEALSALMPLIKANIANIEQVGVTAALTGPIERNDLLTVQKHLQVMPKELKGLYQDLSCQLTAIAQAKNQTVNYDPLRAFLIHPDSQNEMPTFC